MRLTVGDATIANPIAWDLADVKLEFLAEQAGSTEQASQGQTNHIINKLGFALRLHKGGRGVN